MEAKALATKQPSLKEFFNQDNVRAKFTEILGKRASAFITSVLQITASSKLLKSADPASVYQAAAVAATLDLPLNNSLGFAYIVPYNQKQKDGSYKVIAQFQMGYKGFIQLAQRSGQFKTMSVTHITKSQLKSQNPLIGFEFDFTQEPDIIVGYAAYFSLINGFEKTLYMSNEELKAHGVKYSQTFKKGYGLWKDEFDSMARKTVLKLLLSKYAPLSVDMQRAVITDQALIKNAETDEVEYPDNEEVYEDAEVVSDKETDRIKKFIEGAKTLEQLKEAEPHVTTDELKELYCKKGEELDKKEKEGKK